MTAIDLRNGRSTLPIRGEIDTLTIAQDSTVIMRRGRRLTRRHWPDLSIESESTLPQRPEAVSADGRCYVIKEVDGDFLKGTAVSTLTLRCSSSRQALKSYTVKGLANRTALSPTGRRLVAALLRAPADVEPRTDAVLIIDTAATERAVREVSYGANPAHFAFSGDDARVAVAGRSGTIVLNLSDLASIGRFSGPDSDGVALTADGRYVATADRDAFVRVRDVNGQGEAQLVAYSVAAYGEASLQFTPDARSLVAGFIARILSGCGRWIEQK